MKVVLNGTSTVLADSNDTIVVEGNHYFPPSAVNKEFFTDSKSSGLSASLSTSAGTKSILRRTASYYNASVDSNVVKDVAWYYPEPSDKAQNIKDYVAFYKVRSCILSLWFADIFALHRTRSLSSNLLRT
ncbi:NTP-transf-9 domain-containing protein [Mycena chlorophos]|uniref:NTP-transf-9 domain-containing protein n=1 Tax=Mycena chlorophos TaxID=658473 RepID=A0A8H6S3B5_MYCCL|nr:NTP-transf-9 domain-containing protein [Mycena chlorophos]